MHHACKGAGRVGWDWGVGFNVLYRSQGNVAAASGATASWRRKKVEATRVEKEKTEKLKKKGANRNITTHSHACCYRGSFYLSAGPARKAAAAAASPLLLPPLLFIRTVRLNGRPKRRINISKIRQRQGLPAISIAVVYASSMGTTAAGPHSKRKTPPKGKPILCLGVVHDTPEISIMNNSL
ncbi:hypothetical protein ACLOJK_039292 [Asimina triloba]